ncbi:unnamed protein product [Trypanosoma congolense IL3000]|uniref:WGS project CAEQ00000000 data, annotated contig 1701 n=1 Tax=Trypanosoma congolense (strain IL3000) TaxID=1068625 RepID=F9W841_TRYCI|nr:unnamed protein product [Trypanosoma congolense IL3000]
MSVHRCSSIKPLSSRVVNFSHKNVFLSFSSFLIEEQRRLVSTMSRDNYYGSRALSPVSSSPEEQSHVGKMSGSDPRSNTMFARVLSKHADFSATMFPLPTNKRSNEDEEGEPVHERERSESEPPKKETTVSEKERNKDMGEKKIRTPSFVAHS